MKISCLNIYYVQIIEEKKSFFFHANKIGEKLNVVFSAYLPAKTPVKSRYEVI